MARLFMQGLGVPKDCAAAASLLVLPASWGNWSFANRWGLDAYLNDRNPSAALILFARAASLGYDRAQMNLVWLLRSHPSDARNVLGSGERVRAAEATMLRRATRLGNGEAALELALEYAAGRIVRGGTEGAEAAVRLW